MGRLKGKVPLRSKVPRDISLDHAVLCSRAGIVQLNFTKFGLHN